MSSLLFLAAIFVLLRIKIGGYRLTLGATSFIIVTQVCNMALTLIVIRQGTDIENWARLIAPVLTALVLGLSEYVMWGYAYCYWVTSQNVENVYFNMAVMYSDLT